MVAGGTPNDRLARLIKEAGFETRKSLARAVMAESERAGDPLPFCDHTYVTRWLDGRVPNGKTPMFIAAALSRALRRQVTPGDIGMPFAGHLPTINLGLAYPNTSTDAAGTLRSFGEPIWMRPPCSTAVVSIRGHGMTLHCAGS